MRARAKFPFAWADDGHCLLVKNIIKFLTGSPGVGSCRCREGGQRSGLGVTFEVAGVFGAGVVVPAVAPAGR